MRTIIGTGRMEEFDIHECDNIFRHPPEGTIQYLEQYTNSGKMWHQLAVADVYN